MILWFRILVTGGFLTSIYAFYVRYKVLHSPPATYFPLCDISPEVSCSRAFGSRYSKTMGIPNTVGGILYYLFCFILSYIRLDLLVYAAAVSVAFSVYLAYISYIRQRNFCLVCAFIYVINLSLLGTSYLISRSGF